jgi:hypothetical protein
VARDESDPLRQALFASRFASRPPAPQIGEIALPAAIESLPHALFLDPRIRPDRDQLQPAVQTFRAARQDGRQGGRRIIQGGCLPSRRPLSHTRRKVARLAIVASPLAFPGGDVLLASQADPQAHRQERQIERAHDDAAESAFPLPVTLGHSFLATRYAPIVSSTSPPCWRNARELSVTRVTGLHYRASCRGAVHRPPRDQPD